MKKLKKLFTKRSVKDFTVGTTLGLGMSTAAVASGMPEAAADAANPLIVTIVTIVCNAIVTVVRVLYAKKEK